jgi:hypothetical protein
MKTVSNETGGPSSQTPARRVRRAGRRVEGQSLIESAFLIIVISLIFFGLLQVAHLFSARQLLGYGAFVAARSRAVGFNRWITEKALNVGTIPAAGPMLAPERGLRPREQLSREISAIPAYLQSYYPSDALRDILDYEDWEDLHLVVASDQGALLRVNARWEYPLRWPMHRAFYAADRVRLETSVTIDNHHPVYLDVD